jgi:hypothetical protein
MPGSLVCCAWEDPDRRKVHFRDRANGIARSLAETGVVCPGVARRHRHEVSILTARMVRGRARREALDEDHAATAAGARWPPLIDRIGSFGRDLCFTICRRRGRRGAAMICLMRAMVSARRLEASRP